MYCNLIDLWKKTEINDQKSEEIQMGSVFSVLYILLMQSGVASKRDYAIFALLHCTIFGAKMRVYSTAVYT